MVYTVHVQIRHSCEALFLTTRVGQVSLGPNSNQSEVGTVFQVAETGISFTYIRQVFWEGYSNNISAQLTQCVIQIPIYDGPATARNSRVPLPLAVTLVEPRSTYELAPKGPDTLPLPARAAHDIEARNYDRS